MDVALLMARLSDPAATARKIGMPKAYDRYARQFRSVGRAANPTDLLAHQAVVLAQRPGGATWAFRQGTSESHVTLGGRVRVSAAEGIRKAVLVCLGLAVGSERLFALQLKSGAVISVLTEWSLPPVDLWAVFPTGRLASAKARAFPSFVESQMAIDGFAASRVEQE